MVEIRAPQALRDLTGELGRPLPALRALERFDGYRRAPTPLSFSNARLAAPSMRAVKESGNVSARCTFWLRCRERPSWVRGTGAAERETRRGEQV